MYCLIFLLVALASAAFCRKPIPPTAPLLRTRHLIRQRFMNYGDDNGDDITSKYPWLIRSNFTQKLDHFNPMNTETWNQRYYYNPKYSRNNSIIFLMIGGEGPEDGTWAAYPEYQYLRLAEEFGAHVFDLEHRFFGQSWPSPNMNFQSLSLLTTEQALADIAYFITSMNQLYGFDNPRWVTFGGSYSGSLSAWFRSKYPELTVGAVASSAPLNLQLNFDGYAEVVQDDLTQTNKSCADEVGKAFKAMISLSKNSSGLDKLNTYFNLEPPFNKNSTQHDITNFFANVYNVFQSMTQYTYDGRDGETHYNLTVKKLCDIMLNPNKTDVISKVYDVFLWYNKITGDPSTNLTVFPNSYSDMIKSISTGNLTLLGDNAASRGWLWLSCNELGLMQTADQENNIFGKTIPLNFFINMCTDIFDRSITLDYIWHRNQATQNYYGDIHNYTATNVVLPNGSMDPWHSLGLFANNTASMFPILISGTAHCSDMYPAYVGEPSVLAGVRQEIKEHVKTFIRYNPATDGPRRGSRSVSHFAFLMILVLSYI